MTQYIDKAAVVAEIERRKKELIELSSDFNNQWACGSLDNILSFINTFETKEVNLEKEIDDWDNTVGIPITTDALKETARHFFELGLKVNNDTVIKKACEWLKENITNNPNANSVLVRNGCVTLEMLIKDFKNHMK